MLSFLLFGDGCVAALVTAEPVWHRAWRFQRYGHSAQPRPDHLEHRRQGFEMHLSGQVPGRIRRWLPEHGSRCWLPHETPTLWAVHAGGRSILDAVQQGLRLSPDALRYSRDVLRDYGNMSSATLMFVLDGSCARQRCRGAGLAMAFGPGLSVETFAFQPPMNLSHAQHAPERMDTDCVDYDDYRTCLRDLSRVNIVTLTASADAVLAGATGQRRISRSRRRLRLWRWRCAASASGFLAARLTGIDLNPWARARRQRRRRPSAHPASSTTTPSPIRPARKFDFIVSSQFTHHLTDEQVVTLPGLASRPMPNAAGSSATFTATALAYLRLPGPRPDRHVAPLRARGRPDLDCPRLRRTEWQGFLRRGRHPRRPGVHRLVYPVPPVRRDPLIIGGGPAGCAVAITLAQAGYRPRILERATGPIDKVCGDFLSIDTLRHARTLGIDPAALGAAPIGLVRVIHGDRLAETALPFPALGLSRRALDAALLERAGQLGAIVRTGEMVRRLTGEPGAWIIEATGHAALSADTVFLATGKHDLRDHSRAPTGQGAVGMKMYLALAPGPARTLDGATELTLFPGGYAGMQPVEDGRTVLCVAVRKTAFARYGGDMVRADRRDFRPLPSICRDVVG